MLSYEKEPELKKIKKLPQMRELISIVLIQTNRRFL